MLTMTRDHIAPRMGSKGLIYDPGQYFAALKPCWTRRTASRGGRPQPGVIDTSVVIGLDVIDPDLLPAELSVSTSRSLSFLRSVRDERSRRAAQRQDRLQRVEATFRPDSVRRRRRPGLRTPLCPDAPGWT